MSEETKFRLTTALLTHGQAKLADHLNVSATELSRKINGDNGWTLTQLAAALDFVGARVIPKDESLIVIPKDEFEALRTLAKKSLESE